MWPNRGHRLGSGKVRNGLNRRQVIFGIAAKSHGQRDYGTCVAFDVANVMEIYFRYKIRIIRKRALSICTYRYKYIYILLFFVYLDQNMDRKYHGTFC